MNPKEDKHKQNKLRYTTFKSLETSNKGKVSKVAIDRRHMPYKGEKTCLYLKKKKIEK